MTNRDRKWKEFLFTDSNFPAFEDILRKSLTMYELNSISNKGTKVKGKEAEDWVDGDKPIPLDVMAHLDAMNSGVIIILSAILEYFHKTKTAPRGCVRIKDTKVFSRLERARHFSAHVIVDGRRKRKVFDDFIGIGILKSLKEVNKELADFILEGIEVYMEMGKLSFYDFYSTVQGNLMVIGVNANRHSAKKETFPVDWELMMGK